MTNEYKWYILNVVAGQENKIADEIKSIIARGITGESIKDVMVPSKTVIKVTRGKKKENSQKLFPGYVFINTNLQGNTYSIINAIPKVAGFLGGKNNPEPVDQKKIDDIINTIENEEQSDQNSVYEIGELVKINDGPFESFSGNVVKFDSQRKKVTVSVSIFGRPTEIELDLNQVEKE
ncbi:transcription termination/antitermination protein NusG [Rickettsiales bacterium]|jgi:transcription termination/antitermination protein NusG|nr:transcription termination/antitermination protein NusG [Rickettsiales bacterium]|tara:strand:- start:10925 stop:11458 length:534 start_codon:yes stop_codon:yes gene_type:complete